MKVAIALVALIAAALAAPAPQKDADATILKYNNENIGVDGYKFDFETSDGVSRSEEGVLKNAGSETESIAVKGIIKWVDADGTPYTLEFIADENGYQPTGAHLPK